MESLTPEQQEEYIWEFIGREGVLQRRSDAPDNFPSEARPDGDYWEVKTDGYLVIPNHIFRDAENRLTHLESQQNHYHISSVFDSKDADLYTALYRNPKRNRAALSFADDTPLTST